MNAGRRPLVAAVAAVAVFAVGLVVGAGFTSGSPAPHRADRPAQRQDSPGLRDVGPRAERGGMAVGFDHSEAGARAAAMAYATAPQRWLYMSDAEIDAAVTAIATPGSAAHLAEEVVAEVRVARDGLAASPGRVWWVVRPLASRVETYAPSRARVVVWTVTVLSAPEVALPQADWLSVAVELTWEGGDWRVVAVADTPGPTPTLGLRDEPWSPSRFDEALAGFERVEEEQP